MKNLMNMLLCLAFGGLVMTQPALAEEDRAAPALQAAQEAGDKAPAAGENWFDRISVGGTIEFEAAYAKRNNDDPSVEDEDASDLRLSTAELSVDAAISKQASAHALFLYEDDEDIVMDEAYFTLSSGEEGACYLKAGKFYAPFGRYETALVSDPLTLEIGETRETAIELGCAFKGLYGALYAYNGDVERARKDDHVDAFGLSAGYAYEGRGMKMDLGADYINNILDSNGLADILDGLREEAEGQDYTFDLKDYVPGLAAHAMFGVGAFTFTGEYVAMLDDMEFVSDIDDPDLLADLGLNETYQMDAVTAWSAELACGFDLAGRETTVAAGYQGMDNGGEFYPERRILAGVSMEIFEHALCALEYRHDTYENDDTESQVTAKLALEF